MNTSLAVALGFLAVLVANEIGCRFSEGRATAVVWFLGLGFERLSDWQGNRLLDLALAETRAHPPPSYFKRFFTFEVEGEKIFGQDLTVSLSWITMLESENPATLLISANQTFGPSTAPSRNWRIVEHMTNTSLTFVVGQGRPGETIKLDNDFDSDNC